VSGSACLGASAALSADGNTAIAGGPCEGNLGVAWVFTRNGLLWSQQGAKLVPKDRLPGAGGGFGSSIALSADGHTALIGGPWDNNSTGAAWVFAPSGGVWTQQGSKLLPAGGVTQAYFGASVALSADGNTAVIGGWLDNNRAGGLGLYPQRLLLDATGPQTRPQRSGR
jgi:hypothetical protein